MEQYNVTGMSCASCQAHVEKAVAKVPGVTGVSVSLLTNTMQVEGTAKAADVIRAVEKAGYGAAPKAAPAKTQEGLYAAEEASLQDRETPILRRRLIASLGFLLALMYVSMGHMMWGWPLPAFLEGDHVAMGIVQLLLAGIVMVINQKFFISGFRGLLHRAPNMDTLVALGSMASFGWSVYALLRMSRAQVEGGAEAAAPWMHEFYFESAAMILALITVGKMLEAMSKGRTTNALKSLMKLAPQTAVLVRDGREEEVPIAEVQPGDIFAVRPGDSIPVDGVVVSGSGAVNEAALTGESIPVDKAEGDALSAATTNLSGYLQARATRVGRDTTLSQIIQLVSDASATKAPIAKVADRVSGVFVPVVMAVAAAVVLVWLALGQPLGFALARGISVLVISCPCALGLATPVAIMVGSGKAAANGILFKTAASLEAAGSVGVVALDKTGTITSGTPRVTNVLPAKGVSEDELFRLAASLEAGSEHPLARAVMAEAEARGLAAEAVQDFRALPGNGLSAQLAGERLAGGNAAFMARELNAGESLPKAEAEALAQEGKTPLYFARDGRLLGVVAVADTLKEEAPRAIRELQGQGLAVVMLTGDNEATARAIGRLAGVDRVIADVRPEGKQQVIRELQKYGKVAMVGDGINDAPALTQADTGIAIGAGTDVAIDSADVVLMNSSLEDVPAAIRLSRATIRNIRENLFWAFIYNIIGIPLAAGALLFVNGWAMSPMFGAFAMSLSSVCVVSNALRLNLFRPHDTSRDRAVRPVQLPETLGLGAAPTACPSLPGEGEGTAAPPAIEADGNLTTLQKETRPMEKTIRVEGMMCAMCEKHVSGELAALPQVDEAVASRDAGTVTLRLNAPVEDSVLAAAVAKAGYTFVG